jgi:conjugal transfer pilus assembly protein TraE
MRYEKWLRDWKTALAENFFLRTLSIMMAVGLILNVIAFRGEDKIIIAPPQIQREFWIEHDKASSEYLEQMGMFFALLGSNLSPSNAEYNIQTLISYVPPSNQPIVKAELSAQALYIKKNNLTQAFFPSTVEVDTETGSVTVSGNVVRNIGTTKISQEEMIIKMTLTTKNYRTYISEFYMDYPQKKKQELIKKGEIIEEPTERSR